MQSESEELCIARAFVWSAAINPKGLICLGPVCLDSKSLANSTRHVFPLEIFPGNCFI